MREPDGAIWFIRDVGWFGLEMAKHYWTGAGSCTMRVGVFLVRIYQDDSEDQSVPLARDTGGVTLPCGIFE